MKNCDCDHALDAHQPIDGGPYAGWCSAPTDDGTCDCESPTEAGLAIPHPVSLWVAAGDSSHFTFTAYGITQDAARATFATLIQDHVRAYDADPDWAASMLEDVAVVQVHAGVGYRDGEVVA